VFEPGARERQVYLPRTGGGWHDFWTERPIEAEGRWSTIAAPLETLPLFVRAGSILPFGPLEQFVGEKASDELTLTVFPRDGRAEFVLREDAGDTRFSYADGELQVTPLGGASPERTYNVRLAGTSRQASRRTTGPTTLHL
jgi:alpha-glucosidase (family GH31 glycosyl hydrolase)